LQQTYPADGATGTPTNGVVSVWVGFFEGAWPSDEVVQESIRVAVTDPAGEPIEGDLIVEREAERVRFVPWLPLAEGVSYRAQVDFDNDRFGEWGVDQGFVFGFTTGEVLEDELAPAFSGLQGISVGEEAAAVGECCESLPEFCSPCSDICQWCWTVDWRYLPSVELRWRSVQQGEEAAPVTYLLYKVDGPEGGSPQKVLRGLPTPTGEQTLRLGLGEDDLGPYCYQMKIVDLYGNVDTNRQVVCGRYEDRTLAERQEIPVEDRSGCATDEPEEDVGPGDDAGSDDVGSDDVGSDDAGSDDMGAEVDAGGDGGEVMVGGLPASDEGCGCQSVAGRVGGWGRWGALVLGGALVVLGASRRRAG
jgi:hypothetical protein